MLQLKSYYPAEIDVDGETMKIRVRRLNFAEGSELRAKIRQAQAAKAKEEDDDGLFSEELVSSSIREYVSVESNVVIEDLDGNERPVKTGEDLLDAFGGRRETLLAMYMAVLRQNSLTVEEKNDSSSPTGSGPSSGGQEKEAAGPKPATTAAGALNGGSVGSGDATSAASGQSGSTGLNRPPSSRTSARSFH